MARYLQNIILFVELNLETDRGILQQEENNKLKTQNEELSGKLRRAEIFLSRVKEDLARLRSSAGVKTSINFDEEQRLMIKLKVSYKRSSVLYND